MGIMPEEMNLSVNGHSQVPPGFRFHPTEEELLHYYLAKKVASKKIDLDVIRDVDLNKLEPWDIQEKCRIGSTPQNDWYFFSHKDKKYPTGTRTNRATAAGFWKATGRDKVIYSNSRRIGMRKTLVFYKGRAPHGQKSDWIMHEYRLDDKTHDATTVTACSSVGELNSEDGWVVCRVFKKKNYHKAMESSQNSSTSMDSTSHASNDGILDRILVYMGRSCKQEYGTKTIIPSDDCMKFVNNPTNVAMAEGFHAKFMHLPRLEIPTTIPSLPENSSSFNQDSSFGVCGQSMNDITGLGETEPVSCTQDENSNINRIVDDPKSTGLSDWVVLHRLVASQLNGQVDDRGDDFCFPLDHNNNNDSEAFLTNPHSIRSHQAPEGYSNELDFWSFARSSSPDPLRHLSV